MKSVMEHSFSQVPRANIPRSSFNRSHGVKTTLDADYLVPVFVDDVVPGDTFNLNMTFFTRLSTPIYPIMDNMYLESFFFFVPYRLLWYNFPKFHGAQDDPGDSISYTIPAIDASTTLDISDITNNDYRTLLNYMGFPPLSSMDASEINALPFRAYNLIWDEWFRDENLQDAVWKDGVFGTDYGGDGPDDINGSNLFSLLKRGKRHDYFTSCLPWPQKGDAVELTAEVRTAGGAASYVSIYSDGETSYQKLDSDAAVVDVSATAGAEANRMYIDPTINELRLAFQTQKLLERDARSGTRYNEMVLAHFGVTVPDFRVQRPEFLGGGSSPINITPVARTGSVDSTVSVTGGDEFTGDLAGYGVGSGRHGFTKSFVEHGVVIGLINVRGDITYSQGIERYWRKSTRYDFYYPVLAQIGEQTVLNQEIYAQGSAADDNVFGYQERYAEYRYKPSRLTGLFNVDVASNLDEWHLSEDFASLPTLGSSFIQSNTGSPLDRAVAVPTEPHFIFDAYLDLKCARPMPMYGVPGNLDHF